MAPRADDDEIEAVQSLQDELIAAEHNIASGMGLSSQDVPHVREVLLRLVVETWRKSRDTRPSRSVTLPFGIRGESPFDDELTPVIGPLGHQKKIK